MIAFTVEGRHLKGVKDGSKCRYDGTFHVDDLITLHKWDK